MMPIMVPLVGVQDDVLKALDDFLLDITLNYDSNKSFFDFVEVKINNGLASCKIMDIDSNLREWLLHEQHKQLVVSLTQVDMSLEDRPRDAADRKVYFRVGINRVPLPMLVKYPNAAASAYCLEKILDLLIPADLCEEAVEEYNNALVINYNNQPFNKSWVNKSFYSVKSIQLETNTSEITDGGKESDRHRLQMVPELLHKCAQYFENLARVHGGNKSIASSFICDESTALIDK